MGDEKKKDKATTDGVITAVYKVNLHCRQCARKIKKPLIRTQGVHSVDVEIEKGEIKVKGVIDVIKIHKLIEKLSQKKVELVSPQIKEKAAATQTKVKETQEPILSTTLVKVHLHCDKCEQDLRKKLLKHKGIYSVKTDMKAQTLTVQGTIKSDDLLSYIRKNVHKHAEIVSSKTEAKEEKKEAKKDDVKDGAKSSEKTQVTEFKQQEKVEVKSKEGNTPYFVHYVYAPQLFSDENPNACSIL
ncbi:hypothetical protein QUC31_006929 [Theobroma cacao]|uniref:Heavy metal-associated isoprenylated plant protein 3 n=2 Tax=Theobroma cacao TaxID=3641 RepID=A0AB32VCK9_THECC|nr:PREDICTED: heavy metal-associated isoprenylated plant protein 3 [Theobroma cacao]EOY20551.1 Metal ion binding protein, putative [Theobroma cacao]